MDTRNGRIIKNLPKKLGLKPRPNTAWLRKLRSPRTEVRANSESHLKMTMYGFSLKG